MKESYWKFWDKPEEEWPVDQEQHVFLLKAVHPIGKALFPNEWTGTEPTDAPMGLRRDSGLGLVEDVAQWDTQPLQRLYIWGLLSEHYPVSSLPSKHPDDPGALVFSKELWDRGLELSAIDDRRIERGLKRFRKVRATIQSAILSGELKTALRDIPGGSLAPLNPAAKYWATEDRGLTPRFVFGQMVEKSPFSQYASSPFHSREEETRRRMGPWQYVYVDEAGLGALVQSLVVAETRATDHAHTYAIETKRRRAAPKNDAIIEVFHELYPNGRPSSVMIKTRNTDITAKLKDRGFKDVSAVTIRGALKKIDP